MADDAGVLAAARAIRPLLTDMLGPNAAADVARRVDELLDGPDDIAVTAERLRALLGEHPDTAWFLRRVLDDAPRYRPPHLLRTRNQPGDVDPAPPPWERRGSDLLLGDSGWVDAERYRCPHQGCTVDWERYDAQETPPDCPHHHVRLVNE